MCTIDMHKISISSARADDNRAYGSRGNTNKLFFVSDDTCQQSHTDNNNSYYINVRDSSTASARPVYNKQFVEANSVYQLNRQYRRSKSNKFDNMIAVIKCVNSPKPYRYYMYLSRWHDHDTGDSNKDFVVERHGNAKTFHAAPYYRKDDSVFEEVRKRLEDGTAPDEVYIQMNKRNDQVTSASQIVGNPRLVHNQKQKLKSSCSNTTHFTSEGEALIGLVHTDSFVQSVRFDNDSYSSVNYLPHMINDIKRFCVHGNSPLVVDTTFQVSDKLWYTDSSYENEFLIDDQGKHPHFPGPSQWQFRKNQQSFRRLIRELIIADPELQNIKMIGHDLDAATAGGLKDLLPNANHLWCTQHLQRADSEQLRKIGANRKLIDRIMADIYGSQVDTTVCEGLADALDSQALAVKLETLQDIWDDLVPGFYEWFRRRRVTKFETCLVLSARDSLGIGGRFYSNNLELKHHLLKKNLQDLSTPKDVAASSFALTKWVQENLLDESRKVVIGQGKYRLSPGYIKFLVNPAEWVRWSAQRKLQHFEEFIKYNPSGFQKYVKPADSGSKRKPGKKRRARLPEPDLFVPATVSRPPVTPLKVKKTVTSWEVNKVAGGRAFIDVFDPHRTKTKIYMLVHRKDKSSFPGNVKRYEECKVSFTDADVIAVKTTAFRDFTDAHGNRRKHTGNVYLHYLNTCLKGHDQKIFSRQSPSRRKLKST